MATRKATPVADEPMREQRADASEHDHAHCGCNHGLCGHCEFDRPFMFTPMHRSRPLFAGILLTGVLFVTSITSFGMGVHYALLHEHRGYVNMMYEDGYGMRGGYISPGLGIYSPTMPDNTYQGDVGFAMSGQGTVSSGIAIGAPQQAPHSSSSQPNG